MKRLAFALLAALWSLHGQAQQPADQNQQVAQVKTIQVRQQPITQTLAAYGNVTFSAGELTMVSLPFAAQVTRLAVSNGLMVRKGALLFEALSDPASQASLMQAQSAVELARGELQRAEAMAAQQLATTSQVASAKKALADANANLAALQIAGVSLHPHAVPAPFDAVVVNVAAAQGDRLAPNAPVLQLGRVGNGGAAHVLLGVEPGDLGQVKMGAHVELRPVESRLPQGKPLGAQVTSIKGAINPQTRLVDITVTLEASSQVGLPPGTLMQAAIEVSHAPHWVVPRAAVLSDEKGDYLFQAVGGAAHRVAVKRSVEQGDLYGVDGPVQENYPVIYSGNYILADGMKIQEVK